MFLEVCSEFQVGVSWSRKLLVYIVTAGQPVSDSAGETNEKETLSSPLRRTVTDALDSAAEWAKRRCPGRVAFIEIIWKGLDEVKVLKGPVASSSGGSMISDYFGIEEHAET